LQEEGGPMRYSNMRWLIIIALLLTAAARAFTDPLPDEIYLGQGEADVRIRGAMPADRLGNAVAARGDVNGDGYVDVAVAASKADGPAGAGTGVTYVFYGATILPDTIDLSYMEADVTITGMQENEWSGYSLTSGDLNNDGFDDLAIGAIYSTTPSAFHAGRVYILFGDQTWSPFIDLSVDSADVIIGGGGYDFRLGASLAVGEVNGDGAEDLLIGAPYADIPWASNGGEIYAFWGSPTWEPRINLEQDPASLTIRGNLADGHFGSAIAAGDVNGDVCDDILTSAPEASPSGRHWAGIAYIFYGNAQSMPDTISLYETQPDVKILGGSPDIRMGSSLATGDLDRTGFADIILGAPYGSPPSGANAGEIYVLLGYDHIHPTIDLTVSPPDMRLTGAAAFDNAGHAVATGDVNADGYCDLLVGAPKADVGTETEAGISYLIYGQSTLPALVDLGAGGADVTIYGCLDGDLSGAALTVGDLNSQGFEDISIGATDADPLAGTAAGEAYIVYGDGENPTFGTKRQTPAGNIPRIRFCPQRAWVKFANGGVGDVEVARIPARPPNTSPHAAQVYWELSTTRTGANIIQVIFRYTDQQIQGLSENILNLWKRQIPTEPFVQIIGASVNIDANRIAAPVSSLGQFAISDQEHPLGVPPDPETPATVTRYRLYPAAPNPFNTSVVLRYDAPATSHVTLTIRNLLGRKISKVVDNVRMPGQYRVTWDAEHNSSGIYFAVMEARGFEAVQKLLLLR
jgi:hypothetical protein